MTHFGEIFIASAFAEEATKAPAKPTGPGGMAGMFLPMLLVFVIFYFLLIRPQQKERKRHQALVQNLKKGDSVVTSSGIHGQVAGINDNLITLEIADNVRIKMERTQIATVKGEAPRAAS